MKKQIIITIGREYGSAGHYIAEKMAQKLGIALYDKKFFEDSHDEIGYSREIMQKYDEKPVNVFISRKIVNHTNSIEEIVQQKVSEFISARAESGESFVIVGRCSDQVLRNNKNAIHIFIMGTYEDKLNRIMQIYKFDREKAAECLKKHDKKRRNYHNTYSDLKWGDSRGYHICINSSIIGIDSTVELLCEYAEKFKNL